MVSAAPRRDPLAVINSLQAKLAELRLALIEPGPLCPADRVLAAKHVQFIAVSLFYLQRTVERQEGDECHG